MKCTSQSPTLQLSLGRRIFIFILGFTDNCLFGGAIFGWPQLVYNLKLEGLYEDLCDENTLAFNDTVSGNSASTDSEQRIIMGMDFTDNSHCLGSHNSTSVHLNHMAPQKQCLAQDEKFALLFTTSIVVYGLPGIAVGYFLHYAGIRITRLLGMLMVAASFVFLSLATVEHPDYLFPSVVLLSMGGNQLRMGVMQMGDLFPGRRATAATVLSGVYAASASFFLLLSISTSHGLPRRSFCLCTAGFCVVSACLSCLLPPHHIPFEEDNSKVSLSATECSQEFLPDENHKKVSAEPPVPLEIKSEPSPSAPLWTSLRTLSSSLHLYWFFVVLFGINVYQQFYNVWVTASTCSVEEAGYYSTLYSYSNLVSVLCAPLGGLVTDWLVRKARKDQSNDRLTFLTKEVQANTATLLTTSVASLCVHGCLFFFRPAAILVSLVGVLIVRPCVFAISVAYIRIRFPPDHFNRLQGVYCTAVSSLMYLQYPLFKWAQSNYYAAQGLLGFLILLSVSNSAHLLFTSYVRKCVRERESFHATHNGLPKERDQLTTEPPV